MTQIRYTEKVPLYLKDKLSNIGFDYIPTYAEVLDRLMDNEMWLETTFNGFGLVIYEFKDMRKEMQERICCGGGVRALDLVIEDTIAYILRRGKVEGGE